MKSKFQKLGSNECGAICIAMLAGVSKKEARTWLYGNRKGGRTGRKRVVDALIKNSSLRPKTNGAERLTSEFTLPGLEHDALVYAEAITIEDAEICATSKHWVVWDHTEQTIRDPLGFSKPLRFTSVTQFLSN